LIAGSLLVVTFISTSSACQCRQGNGCQKDSNGASCSSQ
jgi:hypothetical protein